jgi:hypothetical protein
MAVGVILIIESHGPLGVEDGRHRFFEKMHIVIAVNWTGRIRVVERERTDPDRDAEGVGEGLRILRGASDGETAADLAVEQRRAARAEGDRRERDARGGNRGVRQAHGVEAGSRACGVVERPVARGV